MQLGNNENPIAAFVAAILTATTPGVLGEYAFAFKSNGLLVNFLGR